MSYITCHCGCDIKDTTDSLRSKGHLIPDQDLYALWDEIDHLLDRVGAGELTAEEAYMPMRRSMSLSRVIYECYRCGRIYFEGINPGDEFQSFVPENKNSQGLLRSRSSK